MYTKNEIMEMLSNYSCDELFNAIKKDTEQNRNEILNAVFRELKKGNRLVKKWMPRLNSNNNNHALYFVGKFRLSYKEYRVLIKNEQ